MPKAKKGAQPQKSKATPAAQKAAAVNVAKKGVQKKKKNVAKKDNPLFEKRPRNFGIGNDIQPKRDLTRFVRWPKYIKLQRQRRILVKRLKVPPVINQFNRTLDKHTAKELFTLLEKYSPETKKEKKQRLLGEAKKKPEEKQQKQKDDGSTRPKVIKYGLNHVTSLIEHNQVALVVIAHDVDPIELVLWLPTLCKKKNVPYVIVKGKARLGKVVHKKTAAVLAVTKVDTKDANDLKNFTGKATDNYLARYSDTMKVDGGAIMGYKHKTKLAKEERRRQKEKRNKEGTK